MALTAALVHESDLLVLDEPTNHLDIDAIAWLEEHLAAFRGGLVLITHDRFVLDRVTTRIAEIDSGQLFVYQTRLWRVPRRARAAGRARGGARRRSRRNLARRELAWLRRGAPARSTKQRARVDRATALIDSTQNRDGEPSRAGSEPVRSRLGDASARRSRCRVAWGRTPVRFDSDLPPVSTSRSIVANVSASSVPTAAERAPRSRSSPAGIDPTEGRVVRGPTVRLGYYDQRSRALDPSITVRAAARRRQGRGRLARPQVDGTLLVRRRRGASADLAAVGRRAAATATAADAARTAQRVAARRAHERLGSRHVARARRFPRRLARCRRHRLARPGAARPHVRRRHRVRAGTAPGPLSRWRRGLGARTASQSPFGHGAAAANRARPRGTPKPAGQGAGRRVRRRFVIGCGAIDREMQPLLTRRD